MLQLIRKSLLRSVVLIFIFLGVALTFNTFAYLNFNPQFGFLRLKQEAISTGWYLPAYYAHIFMGGIVLTVGFFQFSKKFRRKFTTLHRVLGYIYFVGILIFAAPGGMVMACFINRGPIVFISFLLQCTFWTYFTYMALRKIMARQIAEHEIWIIRSFALTLAAITLRLYILGASYFIDLSKPMAYGIFALLSWTPNLIVAEVLISKKQKPFSIIGWMRKIE